MAGRERENEADSLSGFVCAAVSARGLGGSSSVIRHYDGTLDCAAKISAQSKRGKIIVVQWCHPMWLSEGLWRAHDTGHRVVLTFAEAEKLVKVWARWQEHRGHLSFKRSRWAMSNDGYSCSVQTYDPHTRRKIFESSGSK